MKLSLFYVRFDMLWQLQLHGLAAIQSSAAATRSCALSFDIEQAAPQSDFVP